MSAVSQLRIVLLLAFFVMPAAAFAQTGIAGEVKDTSGAVLPGVTVEASSPALIERIRTATTDVQGQFKILDLRPGTYSVTFTLPGFSTAKRAGIELSGTFTATVNAEMQVGGVEETITVSGRSPLVDVQNVVQTRVVTKDVIDAIPTARTFHTIGVVVPGVTTATSAGSGPTSHDVGGSAGDRSQQLAIHGSIGRDMQNTIDGIQNNNANGVALTGMFIDAGSIQEFSYQLGAVSAELQTGGVHTSIIPKDGGNVFAGTFFGTFSNHSFQSDNSTDELRAQGLPEVNHLDKVWDINPSFGGPLKRDRLWMYFSTRYWGLNDRVAGTYYDTDPTDLVYTPDLSRRAIDDTWQSSVSLRPTWQMNQKNKLVGYFNTQGRCLCHSQTRPTTPPEISRRAMSPVDYWGSLLWTSMLSNRLLLDVGTSYHYFAQTSYAQPGISESILPVQELSTGLMLRAPSGLSLTRHGPIVNYKSSLSYVTGSHALKSGFTLQRAHRRFDTWTNGDMVLRLLNGVPRQVQVSTTPYILEEDLNAALGVFVQDQWTSRRLTLNLGVRFDYHNASVPETHLPPARFVGARDFPRISNVPNWTDLSPRLGASFDLFGNGKTAVKITLSRYVAGEMLEFPRSVHPVQTSVNTATRNWTDTNNDFVPQESELGPLSNANFGKLNITTRYADEVREGFGSRGFNWETSAGIQHQLLPIMSVNASYHRRAYANFTLTDNLDVKPSDYDSFCMTSPRDPRLPGGGGQQVCGLADIVPARFGVANNNLVTFSKPFGKQSEIYNGVDLTMNARLGAGALVAGGVSVGRVARSRCFAVDSPEELRFCDVKPPFQPNAKFLATYPLPWGLQAAATFQSLPGPEISASYVATNADARASLGRNLSGGANATKTVPLIAPGSQYGERIFQVDARASKIIRVGRLRVQANFDLYNLFNVNPVMVYNFNYGPSWLQPTYVLPGRLLKMGAQIDF
jgi:hypothetical protein